MRAQVVGGLAVHFLVGLLISGPAMAGDDAAATDQERTRLGSVDEVIVTLRVPLHSPLFARTPVATVDDEPITVRDLTAYIAAIHATQPDKTTAARQDYADLLERVITTQLIVQEARNMGLDETTEFQREMDAFSQQRLISNLMAKQLEGVEPSPDEVEELYLQMSREFRLSTLRFSQEADALLLQQQLQSGGDFDVLARRFIAEGKAVGELDAEQYMKLKDLLPQIAQAVSSMEIGAVSQVFGSPDGFLLFRVEEVRNYDDPRLKDEARRKVLAPLRRKRAAEYGDELERRYVTVDERLLKKVSFEPEETGVLWFRKKRPVDFQALLGDQRVLATIHGDEPTTITVADLAARLEQSFFHGIERALDRTTDLNKKKRIAFKNMLFTRTATIEARRLGLDQSEEYRDALEEHARSLLFGAFVDKAIVPDVRVQEEEIRAYYNDHIDEFSTPKMFRMDDLVFYKQVDAGSALAKLEKGADFQWVSANSAGQVDKDTQGMTRFDNVVLSATALPETLRIMAETARQGDSLLYASPDDYYHVILIRKLVPPKPQEYESVRRDIAEIISNEKIKELIHDWARQLKEAYETRVFVADLPE